jgi:hypothetical protein
LYGCHPSPQPQHDATGLRIKVQICRHSLVCMLCRCAACLLALAPSAAMCRPLVRDAELHLRAHFHTCMASSFMSWTYTTHKSYSDKSIFIATRAYRIYGCRRAMQPVDCCCRCLFVCYPELPHCHTRGSLPPVPASPSHRMSASRPGLTCAVMLPPPLSHKISLAFSETCIMR